MDDAFQKLPQKECLLVAANTRKNVIHRKRLNNEVGTAPQCNDLTH